MKKSRKKESIALNEDDRNGIDLDNIFAECSANRRIPGPPIKDTRSTRPPLFEMLDDIRTNKTNLMRIYPDIYEKEFSLYVVNRFLSSELANIYYVQDMNMWGSSLSKDQQYDFLCYGIPKNKKWLTYPKKEKTEQVAKYIMEYFSFSRAKTEAALKILTEQQLDEIIEKFEKHLK